MTTGVARDDGGRPRPAGGPHPPPAGEGQQPFALVVGYGNPLRTDDGLGWQIARDLAAEQAAAQRSGHELAGVRIVAEHQLTPELAEIVSQARLVVFVDARDGERPGRVSCEPARPAVETALTFSHDADPPALLGLARLLYGRAPSAFVVSIDGADFGYGTGLSAVVTASVPEALRQIRGLLGSGPAHPAWTSPGASDGKEPRDTRGEAGASAARVQGGQADA